MATLHFLGYRATLITAKDCCSQKIFLIYYWWCPCLQPVYQVGFFCLWNTLYKPLAYNVFWILIVSLSLLTLSEGHEWRINFYLNNLILAQRFFHKFIFWLHFILEKNLPPNSGRVNFGIKHLIVLKTLSVQMKITVLALASFQTDNYQCA